MLNKINLIKEREIKMKTFLIWLGIVTCSILGGYAYTQFEGAGKIILLSLIFCLSVSLLAFHNKISKKIEVKQHFQIFRATSLIGVLFCIGMFIIKKVEYSESVRVATLMLTVLCTVSACYESRYTAE